MKTPASVPEIRQHIRALAERVVGERPDTFLLVPVLMRSLSVEVNDFVRYFIQAGDAEKRVGDHQILLASPIAKRTKVKK